MPVEIAFRDLGFLRNAFNFLGNLRVLDLSEGLRRAACFHETLDWLWSLGEGDSTDPVKEKLSAPIQKRLREETALIRNKVLGLFELAFDSDEFTVIDPEVGIDFLPLPRCLGGGQSQLLHRPVLWRSDSWTSAQQALFAEPSDSFTSEEARLLRQVCNFLGELDLLHLDVLLSECDLLYLDATRIDECGQELTEELADILFGEWRARLQKFKDRLQIAISKFFDLIAAADPEALFDPTAKSPFYPLPAGPSAGAEDH